jgi:hypothetical protein
MKITAQAATLNQQLQARQKALLNSKGGQNKKNKKDAGSDSDDDESDESDDGDWEDSD